MEVSTFASQSISKIGKPEPSEELEFCSACLFHIEWVKTIALETPTKRFDAKQGRMPGCKRTAPTFRFLDSMALLLPTESG